MERLKTLIVRYKSFILYVLFGLCTTLVNIVVYYICAHLVGLATVPSTIIAWVAAVLVAFSTNRKWVFNSEETTRSGILKEAAKFFGCRLATGIVDWVCMFIFVDLLKWNDILVKVGVNVLVIVLNYVASKLFVFRKTGTNRPSEKN